LGWTPWNSVQRVAGAADLARRLRIVISLENNAQTKLGVPVPIVIQLMYILERIDGGERFCQE
jgi:hypothetical protein